jgi:hypothetical protein
MRINPETKDLYLRVHTRVAGSELDFDDGNGNPRKWATRALFVDCETALGIGQRFTFGFYRRCALLDGTYQCIEEGIIYADDLGTYLGEQAVELLHDFANNTVPDTIRGRFAKMRIHSQTDFLRKVFFPTLLRDKGVAVGANLAFDLATLCKDYTEMRLENYGFSCIAVMDDLGENPVYPRIRFVPKNSRTAFIDLAGGGTKINKKFRFKNVGRGRFLDVLTLAFSLRNQAYGLESACHEWKVPGKLDHKPTGKVSLDEIRYCREDVRATVDLLNAQKAEYDTFPISLPPEQALSSASIAKAFHDSLGVRKPADKFRDLPEEVHGVAMESYYGGRAEVRIRGVELPVVMVDYTSNYPSSATLLQTWNLLTAQKIRVVDFTSAAKKILAALVARPDAVLDRNFWKRLDFIALAAPDGHVVPIRTTYNEIDGENTNIGLNPLFAAKHPIWLTGPDLAAAVLLSGWVPKVLKAKRLVPIDKQSGLWPVQVGNRLIDPSRESPYVAWVEQKEVSKGAVKQFIKCLLNSGVYGLAVELNRARYGNCQKTIQIHSGEKTCAIVDNKAEIPGKWYFPWVGSLITGGGRLLLATLEKEVKDRGGEFLMTDTDSMAVISTREGGLVPCPGGRYKMPDGREAIRALSWTEVVEIIKKIQRLSPYDPEVVPQFLKVDKVNLNKQGEQHQIYGIAYSAKRYCLRTEKEIIKPSEHGLGPYFGPAYKDQERFYSPSDCAKDDKYPRWIVELWEVILGMRTKLPKWAGYYSMRKYAVTSPNVLQKLRQLDPASARPYSFCISPILSFGKDTKVAPFNDRPDEWDQLEYISINTGQKSSLASVSEGDEMITGEREETPQSDKPYKLKFLIEEYPKSIEHKSLAPDGSPCKEHTVGLLRRRAIQASGVVQHIGKEVARGMSIDPEYLDPNETLMRYPVRGKPNAQFRYREPEVLKGLSIRQLALKAKVGTKTAERFRAGQQISQKTVKKLLNCARNLEGTCTTRKKG